MFIDNPRFPDCISAGSRGGPSYSTTVVTAFSGRRVRNVNWEYPLHSYDVSYGIRRMVDVEKVLHFFHIAEGRANAFRFKDWADYKSCPLAADPRATDQVLGLGDGERRAYQLQKTYAVGPHSKSRIIQKPVSSTLRVAVDGMIVTAYALSGLGVVTLNVAPPLGAAVSAGFEFDVPCTFDSDELPTSLESYDLGSVSVMLQEERL